MKCTAIKPRRQNRGDAGIDFYAPQEIELIPGNWIDIDTGVCLEEGDLPDGYCMILLPRSGLGVRYGTRFRNTVGVIDSGYRDPIRACMTADLRLTIHKGERFMQGLILPFGVFPWEEEPVGIRDGGYGSTGFK